MKKKEEGDEILKKLNSRIKQADNESKVCEDFVNFDFYMINLISSQHVHEALDQQLMAARAENEKIRRLMGEMGVSPRPTVAQWLQQKEQQRKRDIQEALISWDRLQTHHIIVP